MHPRTSRPRLSTRIPKARNSRGHRGQWTVDSDIDWLHMGNTPIVTHKLHRSSDSGLRPSAWKHPLRCISNGKPAAVSRMLHARARPTTQSSIHSARLTPLLPCSLALTSPIQILERAVTIESNAGPRKSSPTGERFCRPASSLVGPTTCEFCHEAPARRRRRWGYICREVPVLSAMLLMLLFFSFFPLPPICNPGSLARVLSRQTFNGRWGMVSIPGAKLDDERAAGSRANAERWLGVAFDTPTKTSCMRHFCFAMERGAWSGEPLMGRLRPTSRNATLRRTAYNVRMPRYQCCEVGKLAAEGFYLFQSLLCRRPQKGTRIQQPPGHAGLLQPSGGVIAEHGPSGFSVKGPRKRHLLSSRRKCRRVREYRREGDRTGSMALFELPHHHPLNLPVSPPAGGASLLSIAGTSFGEKRRRRGKTCLFPCGDRCAKPSPSRELHWTGPGSLCGG